MKVATYFINSALAIAALNTVAIVFSNSTNRIAEDFLYSSIIGFAVCQLIFLACWTVWIRNSWVEKFRWSYLLLLLQWLSFAVPFSFVHKEWPLPWFILADQAIVWSAALAGAGFVRLVVRRPIETRLPSIRNRNSNFGILDLLTLATASAFFFMVAVGFREEIANGLFSGLIYELMLMMGLCFGIPSGLFLSVFVAGFATNRKPFLKYWSIGWLLFLTSALPTLFAILGTSKNETSFFGTIVLITVLFTSIIAYLARQRGCRWAIASSVQPSADTEIEAEA